jgi:hypothetical protein
MNITKDQISKIISIVIVAAIALLAVFGYDVGVIQPREAGKTVVTGGSQAVLGTTVDSLNVTKSFKSFGVTNIFTPSLTLTGTMTIYGGLAADGLSVADTTGNTVISGTLKVTNTTTLVGAAALNGGLTMDTRAFSVSDTTGNTVISGTLKVTDTITLVGATTATGAITANGGIVLPGGGITQGGLVFTATSPLTITGVLTNVRLLYYQVP